MLLSWPKFVNQCKSRLGAISRACFLGRAVWRDRARRWRRVARRLEQRAERLKLRNEQLKQTVQELKTELAQQKASPATSSHPLELDSVKPPGCQYSLSEISLAVNLSRQIGFRPTTKVLQVLYKWLGVKNKIPSYQAIRSWTQRIGLDRTEHAGKVQGATWILDHTCQTGREKVLTVLRVRPSNSLNQGQPLKFSDLDVLAEVCRSTWTDNDVYEVLQATSERYGQPGALLSDQAHDLQKPARTFQNTAKNVHVLTDFKHFLANQFKLMLQADGDYSVFTKQLQHTCACVQQTELSHFVPRPMKRKARFMNLGPVLQWAETMLWHLDHSDSQSRTGISEKKMEEKFGWLRDFKRSIDNWQQCQSVIDRGVSMINRQGLNKSTAQEFRKLTQPLAQCKASCKLVKQATEFLDSQAQQLREDETVPLSSEIIESVFASYKALEKQHSREGFSSLLLALSTLLRPVTDKEVMRAFARTKCKDVTQWINDQLGCTYNAKRQTVFREPLAHQRTTPRNRATAIAV